MKIKRKELEFEFVSLQSSQKPPNRLLNVILMLSPFPFFKEPSINFNSNKFFEKSLLGEITFCTPTLAAKFISFISLFHASILIFFFLKKKTNFVTSFLLSFMSISHCYTIYYSFIDNY